MSTHVSVLCVGDGAPVQDATTRLEREDDSITVETETKAADALAAVEERQPDCVVSGYALPEADGVELLSSVREVAPGLPFVLIADTIPEADAQRAISLDVTDYFCTDVGAAREELLTERVVSAARQGKEIAASHRSTEQLEREYETVFENVQEALFLLDVDEEGDIRFQRINQREADAIGKSTAAVRGKTPVEVFGEELGAELEANYRECLEKQASITYEEELVFDEEPTVWQTTLTPIVIDGAVERIVGATREITGLKRTQEELERKNDLFEQAQEIADLGAWETDLRTGEGWWTKEVNEIYGLEPDYQPEAGEGIEYYHPEDRPEVREAFERAVEEGESYDIEARIGDAEETRRWARLRGQPRMEDGDAVAVRGTIQDITERKQREQDLERARERLRVLFDEAPDTIVVHDEDGEVIDVNQRLVDELGYSRDELESMTVTDWEVGWELDDLQARWRDMSVGEVIKAEAEHKRRDGSTFPVAVWVNKLTVDGEPRYVAMARDSTERKEREAELRTLKERFELAVDGANLGVWDWDMTTDEVEFNDNWATMLGHDPEEISSSLDEWERRVHPDDLEPVEAALEAHIDGETDYYDTEHRMRTADGGWKWIRDIGQVVEHDADGNPIRAVGIHIDIDERKRAEQELREEREMFTQGPAIVFRWRDEPGWPVEYVTENIETVLGYTPEALLSGEIPFSDIVHEGDAERVQREVEESSGPDTERFSHDPYRVVTADGETRWVLDHTRNRREDGEITHRLGYLVDITERKQREQELRYYERIIEAFSDIATVIGPDGTIQYVSPSVRAVLGYEPDELIGEEGFGYQPQEDTDRVAAAIDEVLEDPSTVRTVETRFRRADGSWCWIEATIQNRLDDDVIDGLLVNSRDITERKERERELEVTKDRLDMALDASRLGVYDWDVADESITFDDRVAELLGFDPEEFEHDLSAWAELTHPEDLPRVESDVEAMLNGDRTSARSEYRVRTKNGDWRWIRSHGRVVEWTGDGEPDRIVGVHQDITERKEREQRLQQFREAIEQTGHAVYITDRDGTIEYVNPAFEELTGYSEAETLGETPNILSSGEYDESFYETFWEALENGEQWEAEMIDQRADGEEIILHQTISPLVDGDEPQKYVAIAQDVTDRKEYEEALKTAREELRQVIDLVPDLVFVKNRDGEYLLANEATADAYGMSPDELEGKKESDVIPEVEDSEQFRKDDIEVIESGEPKEVPEEKLTTADGETRILETTKIPYQSAETSDDAVLGYARDITELKEYEQTLERQRDDLEVLNQVVRHDIRNDLQLVLAYADLLEDHVDEEGEEFIRQVLKAARDAVNITTTARDVTEVLLQSTDDPRPVNLRRVLEEQAEDIRSSHERTLVTVEGPLPSCRVLADGMLESVFRNLLSNAIQHNDKALPEVALSATADDDTVVVRIADNGPGIPDDRKEQIFEEGEKGLDSEGTGLGLYLVETLVDRYGGEVRVEDNDPDGSVFVVELQRAE
ncbi:receiver/sensor box histidine kinase [Natronomonas pharaonis DSM 2160]|uniref:histidine kinase n=1 Tax=Natronomonas pharaonis (strain ATCC 35678 / DSM 2160 / CIP 103997 / JCM 8858 / NBRC 14720 / NCIMB 2260 / Gabara) TaxID=348780 RepID=A0A1U7EWF5_NATPD|nr:PAS domain S-box protein [Natronomonas pharaonis]CAI49419.1 receiver/sensor box histidine kinase [Natronomonas pharaonis DSM 2160]